MKAKVGCRLPSGLAGVKSYMTLFFKTLSLPLILLTPSSSEAVPSWKVLPLLHKLQLERLRGQEKGNEGEKQDKSLSVLWENEAQR